MIAIHLPNCILPMFSCICTLAGKYAKLVEYPKYFWKTYWIKSDTGVDYMNKDFPSHNIAVRKCPPRPSYPVACVIELHIGFSSGGCFVWQHITQHHSVRIPWVEMLNRIPLDHKHMQDDGWFYHCKKKWLICSILAEPLLISQIYNSYLTGVKCILTMSHLSDR